MNGCLKEWASNRRAIGDVGTESDRYYHSSGSKTTDHQRSSSGLLVFPVDPHVRQRLRLEVPVLGEELVHAVLAAVQLVGA